MNKQEEKDFREEVRCWASECEPAKMLGVPRLIMMPKRCCKHLVVPIEMPAALELRRSTLVVYVLEDNPMCRAFPSQFLDRKLTGITRWLCNVAVSIEATKGRVCDTYLPFRFQGKDKSECKLTRVCIIRTDETYYAYGIREILTFQHKEVFAHAS